MDEGNGTNVATFTSLVLSRTISAIREREREREREIRQASRAIMDFPD